MTPNKANSFVVNVEFKIQNKSENLYKQGIYTIINTVDNKMYIGSTTQSFNDRFNIHLYELRNNKHHNNYLQNAVNKYGIDKFILLILEEINEIDNCNIFLQKEKYYIELFDTYAPNGYNIAKVYGDIEKDSEQNSRRIEKIKQRKIHRQKVQFNKEKSTTQCYSCINFNIENEECYIGHALEYNIIRCAKNDFDCSDYYQDKEVDIFDVLPIDNITELYLNGVDICEYEDRLIGGDVNA